MNFRTGFSLALGQGGTYLEEEKKKILEKEDLNLKDWITRSSHTHTHTYTYTL